MQLLLPKSVVKLLVRELRKAGSREIGGLLMGEHVEAEIFRVASLTVQRSGGDFAGFVREPGDHEVQLKRFFKQTNNDYTRFNYLGEWHSHPSFRSLPSTTDLSTMQSIVEDGGMGVNFLVLLIPRLAGVERMELSATAFRAGVAPEAVDLRTED
jgi:integrative and conjugative element protein (TIGR02256 family)